MSKAAIASSTGTSTTGACSQVSSRAARLVATFGEHRPAVPERQQRRALLELRRAAVRGREHAQRPQLLVDQELDVVAGDAPAVLLGHDVGDRLDVALPVGRLGHQVQELRELHDLAVGAAREVRGDLEARALELADQLDPVGALHGDGFRRAHRRH